MFIGFWVVKDLKFLKWAMFFYLQTKEIKKLCHITNIDLQLLHTRSPRKTLSMLSLTLHIVTSTEGGSPMYSASIYWE